MVFHMKTTLVIPDSVFRALKRRAAERGETVSALVTEYLRQGLLQKRRSTRPFRLPSFSVGRLLVNVDNREALFDVLDAERDKRVYGQAAKKD
jgi:plasmid stability protein